MKIHYSCACCGDKIDTVEVDEVDEVKFGFDCLTAEERQDIIKIDKLSNAMFVQSLCDSCIESLGLAEEEAGFPITPGAGLLH